MDLEAAGVLEELLLEVEVHAELGGEGLGLGQRRLVHPAPDVVRRRRDLRELRQELPTQLNGL